MDKVLVLLVDHNSADLVPGVLSSIKEDEVEVSIVLVANGSSDESFRQLQQIADPRVQLVRSKENLGYAGGNNYGLQYALKHIGHFKFVFLLNTDAYIESNLIGRLKKILDSNENAACISPKIFARDGSTWYGGSNFDFKKGLLTSTVDTSEEGHKPYYRVDGFSGCAVLFRVDRFLEAGLFNEKLFLYYEEADCSIKLQKLGYDVLYTPHLTVLHDVSYSTRKVSHIKTYYMTRNKFVVFNKSMSPLSKFYYLVHEFAYFLKIKKAKNAIYHVRGYLDFKRGKSGRLGAFI